MISEILKSAEKFSQKPGVTPLKNHEFAAFGRAIPEKAFDIYMVI